MKKTIFLILLNICITGCASIVSDTTQKIAVNTYPDNAEVTITNSSGTVQKIITPHIVTLKKSDGYFSGESYNLVIEKDGYIPQTKVIESHVNGWYVFGNFFFGGLIGWLLVDPTSGAMYKLEPKEFNIHLEKEEQ